jgi:predicted acyltransferase
VSDPPNSDRLISLDVFRGMTIAGMVLVNNPGTWSSIYGPLKHAEWHGLTPTDWIFPFFLFIVGVATPIALNKRIKEGVTSRVYLRIFSRALIIFALGLAISVTPFFQFAATDAPDTFKTVIWMAMTVGLFFLLLKKFKAAGVIIGLSLAGIAAISIVGYAVVPYNFGTMRIPGVLQRIAVCYLAVSLIYLHTTWKQQLGIAAALLLGYWALMTLIPVPGCEVTTFHDRACNLAAWLDRTILTENHIWRSAKVFDPEGILSTLPAIATTLSGVLASTWLRSASPRLGAEIMFSETGSSGSINSARHDPLNVVAGMFFFGTVLLAVGYIWSYYFPMNKSLWTSSYVLVTSGIALLVLASCYWLVDIKGHKLWTWPFVVFGVNALPLFVFSGITARMLGAFRVAGSDGQPISLQKWLFENIYLNIAQPVDASLLFAISVILFWFFVMWLLYRRQILIKV